MCVTDSTNGDVRVLEPSQDSIVGESLIWQNSGDYEPDERVNIGKKNSFWKKDVSAKLITDKNGNMAFEDVTFTTKNGKCVTSPFAQGQIS